MIKRESIKVLLDRRKELFEEINKLQKEYTALGNVLEEIIRKQKEEENEK